MDVWIVLMCCFAFGIICGGVCGFIMERIARKDPEMRDFFFGDDVDRDGNPIIEDWDDEGKQLCPRLCGRSFSKGEGFDLKVKLHKNLTKNLCIFTPTFVLKSIDNLK